MVYSWRKLQTEAIFLETPTKIGNVYISMPCYSGNISPIKIQFDNLDVDTNGVSLIVDFELNQLKLDIEKAAKQECVANSGIWFKGRSFTKEYINNAFVSSVNTEGVKYYDSGRSQLHSKEIEGYHSGSKVIIEFLGLQFAGKVITALWDVKQILFNVESSRELCLIQDEIIESDTVDTADTVDSVEDFEELLE